MDVPIYEDLCNNVIKPNNSVVCIPETTIQELIREVKKMN